MLRNSHFATKFRVFPIDPPNTIRKLHEPDMTYLCILKNAFKTHPNLLGNKEKGRISYVRVRIRG